ncbi:TldD/PmbA family protein [Caulobacter sp. S45]|uniref:TldD/PmbA family protein n=1 Tax=Caulobacter sp. S45 TaxID=1641861 RepID=UPI00131B6495|nr:TldD/PmbA family protein [Caulobacter sp. S45]
MSIFTEDRARTIVSKVVTLSKADECTASLTGTVTGNARFALNNLTTSGIVENTSLVVEVAFGKRLGTATVNAFDDAALERTVRRAEELAHLAPESPEFSPAVGQQTYLATQTFSEATAAITPDYRAQVAADSIAACKTAKLTAAGYLEDAQGFEAFANSRGATGYQRSTMLDYSCTARTEDGHGSGWVARNLQDSTSLNTGAEVRTAIRKAAASSDTKALEPGKYTVILEPAAVEGMLGPMLNLFNARQADEGRSFLSKKGGGTKVGEQVFGPQVTLFSDPTHPEAAVLPWDDDYLPRARLPLVENGKVMNLEYSAYWAQKQGKATVARPGNLIMSGGAKSTADMIRSTERGILVTRLWYIRMVDPQTVLLTGLTRDGTFYIENGVIKYPIKNFRFNESPVIMLNNVEEMGRPVRIVGEGGGGGGGRRGGGPGVGGALGRRVMLVPPMKVRDFTFSSLSDAI